MEKKTEQEAKKQRTIKTGCPRRLPTITLKNGKTYFIDERLRELRNVNNPFDTLNIYP